MVFIVKFQKQRKNKREREGKKKNYLKRGSLVINPLTRNTINYLFYIVLVFSLK